MAPINGKRLHHQHQSDPEEEDDDTDDIEKSSPVKEKSSSETLIKNHVALASSSSSSSRATLFNNNHNAGSSIIMACLLYCSCSVSMVLTNKSLASGYNDLIESNTPDGHLNVLLVVWQAMVAVICVELCKRLKWVDYPKFNMHTARLWAPVNILFCLMLFTSMSALEHNSVPMVTIYKNITNIVVTFGDYYFFHTKAEPLVICAFGIMLFGAVAAAWNDIYITVIGIFWMTTNCIATAGYVLSLKFATKNVKLSKFGMVYYNNVLCTVFLLPAAIFRGELTLFFRTDALHTMDYFLTNVGAGFVGFFLNFASLNCVAATGPTTYAIVGSLNKIPVTILGYLLFDNVITGETWFFIGLSMCGGFLYSYAKIQTGRRKSVVASA